MRKHVVFTNGRSGSNHLVQVLNQHPNVTNYGEVLGDYTMPRRLHDRIGYGGPTLEDYVDHMLSSRRHFYLAHTYAAARRMRAGRRPQVKRWAVVETVGVKELSIHVVRSELDSYLTTRDDIAVIHLTRHNVLRRLISALALEQAGTVFAASVDDARRVRVTVDAARICEQMQLFEQERAEECAIAASIPRERVLRLVHEDLFASGSSLRAGYVATFEFLGVRPIAIARAHQKVVPQDLSEAVVNYPELVDALDGSPWAHYLGEP